MAINIFIEGAINIFIEMAIDIFIEMTHWHKKLCEKYKKQDDWFSFHYVELWNKKLDGNTELVDHGSVLFQWF
jgi:hypothetical protein